MAQYRRASELTIGEIRASIAMMAGLDPEEILDWQIQIHVHKHDGECAIWSMSNEDPIVGDHPIVGDPT
jgi:hypothetical protein